YPSTSSSVPRFFRMLGSSSTTRIRSFSDIYPTSILLQIQLHIVYRQKERKGTAPSGFAIHPNLASMRLHQALGDCQSEAHPRGCAVHTNKILEDLLVMLGGDSRAGIRYGNLDAVGRLRARATAVERLNLFRRAAFPEIEFGAQCHLTTRGGMFRCVVEEIGNRLLHFLVIEFENRQVAIQHAV